MTGHFFAARLARAVLAALFSVCLAALVLLGARASSVAEAKKPSSVLAQDDFPATTPAVTATRAITPTPGPGWPLSSTVETKHAPASLPGAITQIPASPPVMFVENAGQFAAGARFQARGEHSTVYLADDAIWFIVLEPPQLDASRHLTRTRRGRFDLHDEDRPRQGVNVKLSFAGANPAPALEAFNRLDAHVSYFIGSDPGRWRADVPVWGGVRYVELYPGIDLEITGEAGRLAQRLVAHPGADLSQVRLRVEGAHALHLDGDRLRLSTAVGEYTLPLLQLAGASGAKLDNPTLAGDQVNSPFTSLASQPATPNSQPPDLLCISFGGNGWDGGKAIAVDETGNTYVTGETFSTNFPTTPGVFDPDFNGGHDAFVTKIITASGAYTLGYSTYLGGGDDDKGYGIAVDEAGNAYVTGWTTSADFPCENALDSSLGGPVDAFVVKVYPDGTELDFATYLGGEANDDGYGIAVDGAGHVYVTGYTLSDDLHTTPGVFSPIYVGGGDAFVTKIISAGGAYTYGYSTYLGGTQADVGVGVAVDEAGNAYVAGQTSSSDFPTTPETFDATYNNGSTDAFAAMVSPAGSQLLYSTYLGGAGFEESGSIAADRTGNLYVIGSTESFTFPTTPGAFDTSHNGEIGTLDAFVVKLNPAESRLRYATFLGGSGDEFGWGIAVDGAGNAYVTGEAYASPDFPTTMGAFNPTFEDDGSDTFIVKVNAMGTGLAYATSLGLSGGDTGQGMAVRPIADGGSIAYVTGDAPSNDAFAAALRIPYSLPEDQTWVPCECPFSCASGSQDWAGGPINTRTGNYHYSQPDLSIPALGGPLRFERSYNAQAAGLYTAPLGYGWTHNYDVQLVFSDTIGGQPGIVIVKGCRGSRFRFADNDDGTFDPFPGVWAALTRTLETSPTYVLRGVDQGTYVFDGAGRLVEIRAPQGHALALAYSGAHLARVEDATGQRFLAFQYDAEGRLIEARDPLNRTVRYGYDPATGDLVTVTDTLGAAWTYAYTSTHRLYELRDPEGHVIERTDYDEHGRAVRQWDGRLGQPLHIQYGTVVAITDPLGHVTLDRYSARGVLTAQSNAGGSSARAYDGEFNWTLTTDANGHTTGYAFNALGRPEIITDALDGVMHMIYDDLNNLRVITNAQGFATTYFYSGTLLTKTVDALGNTTIYTYSTSGGGMPSGLLIAQRDAGGRVTRYACDQFGQRTAVTDTAGLVTRYGYDAVGRLIAVTAPGNIVTLNAYDNADRLVRVTRNYTTAGGQNYLGEYNLVTEYAYNLAGRQVSVKDTLGHVTRSEYDAAGRLIRSIQNYLPARPQNYLDQYNIVTEYGYDAAGNQVLVTDTLGYVTRTGYDALNRPVTVTANYVPGGPVDAQTNITHTSGYDAAGNVVTQTDAMGRTTVTQYDALNRPVKVTANYQDGVYDPTRPGEDLSTVTLYDEIGNVVERRDAAGHPTWYAYDTLGRLITTTNALFHETVTRYNAAGQRTETIDPAGHATRYGYDNAGRLVTVTVNYIDGRYDPARPDEDVSTLTVYDELGRRVESIDALGHTTVYTYSPTGRLAAVAGPAGAVTRYRYDALGRTVEVIDALDHATCTGYDALGRVVAVTANCAPDTGQADRPSNVTTLYAHNALGWRIKTRDARGNWTTFEYDDVGRVITTTDATGRATLTTYNRAGERVESLACGPGAGCVAQARFEYDGAGRLAAQSDALGHTTRYRYDAAGNRLATTDANGIVTRYGYDPLSRLVYVTENYLASSEPPGDDPQANVTTRYGYDNLGNRTVITNARGYPTTYAYDALSRLVAVADPLDHTTRYRYDAVGNRTVMTDANGKVTLYAYDAADRLLAITYTADVAAVSYAYDKMGNRLAMTDSAGTTSYVYDALYRPLTITSPRVASGVVGYRYDTAGNRTAMTITLSQPLTRVVTGTAVFTVAASADDAYVRVELQSMDTTAPYLTMGRAPGQATYHAGYRFNPVTLPGGAYLIGAELRLAAYADAESPTIFQVYGEAAGAPQPYTTYDDFVRRQLTRNSVAWEVGPWVQGQAYGVDVSGVVREILAGEWTNGQPMALQVRAAGALGLRQAHSVDGKLELGPPARLRLTYTRTVTTTAGLIVYTYDAANHLASVVDWNGQGTTYGYDAFGRPASVTLPNGVQTAYTYDDAGRLVRLAHSRSDDGRVLSDYRFALDAVGNRVVATETLQLAGGGGGAVEIQPPGEGGESVLSAAGYPSPGSTLPWPTLFPTAFLAPGPAWTSALTPTPAVMPVSGTLAGTGVLTSTAWWAAVQETIRQSEYEVTWQELTWPMAVPGLAAAYQAPNRAHNLRTYFTPAGIHVIPRDVESGRGNGEGERPAVGHWQLGLALTGYGSPGDIHLAGAPAQTAARGNRFEYHYESADQRISEWYVNDERGLEQGFTISHQPPAAGGRPSTLAIELALSGNLTASLLGDGTAIEFFAPGDVGVSCATATCALTTQPAVPWALNGGC